MKQHVLDAAEMENLFKIMAHRIADSLNLISKNRRDLGFTIYGIPRGGIPVAYEMVRRLEVMGFVVGITYDICRADIIVDDIIDSGRTRLQTLATWGGDPDMFFALLKKTDAPPSSEDTQPCVEMHEWVVFPWEVENETDKSGEDIIVRQLQFIGEDIAREGLQETPRRVIKAWSHFFKGYKENPADILGRTFGKETYDEMVILRDIEFFSHCEHHLVPFYGRVHIGYIPGDRVVGISKLARLVECFSRRLQIQERMTEQIASALETHLQARGVAVFVEARHLCMTARGVEKQNSVMVTSSLKGVCRQQDTRMEFLLLQQRHSSF